MKYDFLFRLLRHLQTIYDVRRVLAEGVEEYNARPNFALHGLFPNEALAGTPVLARPRVSDTR
jgi:hypothetical protein